MHHWIHVFRDEYHHDGEPDEVVIVVEYGSRFWPSHSEWIVPTRSY